MRVRARALPKTSAEALEAVAATIDVLRRAPDAAAAATDTVIQEQLVTLRDELANGADSAKVCAVACF